VLAKNKAGPENETGTDKQRATGGRQGVPSSAPTSVQDESPSAGAVTARPKTDRQQEADDPLSTTISGTTSEPAPAEASTSGRRPGSGEPAVRTDEAPWTEDELAELTAELQADKARLSAEVAEAESDLEELIEDSSDSSGDDQADAGGKTFDREHEFSLANNTRDLLIQTLRALDRLADGTYGVCESCGKPIGKARLQAAPRATLCVPCKQREERR
jgi:RNA polymerase-binding transcription factor